MLDVSFELNLTLYKYMTNSSKIILYTTRHAINEREPLNQVTCQCDALSFRKASIAFFRGVLDCPDF